MTPDLLELRDSIRPVLVAAGPAGDAQSAWNNAAELGWWMTAASEAKGGLGLGAASMALVSSEFGRQVARVPSVAVLTAIDAIAQLDLPEPLEAAMGGDYVALSLADVNLQIRGELLSGELEAVPSPDRSSAILGWAVDHSQLMLIPASADGVSFAATPTWDQTYQLATIRVDSVPLARVNVIATGEAAGQLIGRLLSLRDLLIAADCVGVADGLLAMTIEHLRMRHQFKRPLAMFQALKHRVADLRTQWEAANALLATSLNAFDDAADTSEAEHAAIKARWLAAEVCATVAEEALQLHGGIGMASEHACHLYLKRAMLNRQLGRQRMDYPTAVADHFMAAL